MRGMPPNRTLEPQLTFWKTCLACHYDGNISVTNWRFLSRSGAHSRFWVALRLGGRTPISLQCLSRMHANVVPSNRWRAVRAIQVSGNEGQIQQITNKEGGPRIQVIRCHFVRDKHIDKPAPPAPSPYLNGIVLCKLLLSSGHLEGILWLYSRGSNRHTCIEWKDGNCLGQDC